MNTPRNDGPKRVSVEEAMHISERLHEQGRHSQTGKRSEFDMAFMAAGGFLPMGIFNSLVSVCYRYFSF